MNLRKDHYRLSAAASRACSEDSPLSPGLTAQGLKLGEGRAAARFPDGPVRPLPLGAEKWPSPDPCPGGRRRASLLSFVSRFSRRRASGPAGWGSGRNQCLGPARGRPHGYPTRLPPPEGPRGVQCPRRRRESLAAAASGRPGVCLFPYTFSFF